MTEVVDRGNAEHYVWGGFCDGWRHLSRQDLSVIQERIPPGASEVRHRHAMARQVFFVLSGELGIELDDGIRRLRSEQSLEIPPGTAHRVANDGDADAWFLVISSPTTKGDRVDL